MTDIFPVQIEVETGRLKRIRIRGPPMTVTSVMDQVHVIFQEAQEKEIKSNEEKWIANVVGLHNERLFILVKQLNVACLSEVVCIVEEEEVQSLKLAMQGSPEYEVLASSVFVASTCEAGGQPSPSQCGPSTDGVRSVWSL